MIGKSTIRLTGFYLLSIGFILLNIFFVVVRDNLLLNALPVVFAIVLVAVFSLDKIVYLVVFFAPLSILLSEVVPGIGFDMFLPTEPLLVGLLIVFILKTISERGFDRQILTHPVSIAIYANLLWTLFTSFTSTMPLVSFKFLLAQIWFIIGLYFIVAKLFADGKNLEKYVWLYTISLSIVIVYATVRLSGYGLWNKQAAHFVVSPFYNDHTSYGAVIAMYLPFLVLFSCNRFSTFRARLISRMFLLILFAGFVLSYSRAAWISIVPALVVYGIVRLKIRFRPLFIAFLITLGLFFIFQNQIFMKLEENSDQSSANLLTHMSSVSNITTDASNLERINRWSSAIRMFIDKPVLGYGPGTYMFQYAPYQLNRVRTIISTNAADAGNAHSEYLGPLSESGVLGLITVLSVIGGDVYTAVHTYARLADKRLKLFVLTVLVSLVTYYFHGFLNNFLDTDKLTVPFWGFTAMIVALDIYSRKQAEAKKIRAENPDRNI